jgi:hypothetical protein
MAQQEDKSGTMLPTTKYHVQRRCSEGQTWWHETGFQDVSLNDARNIVTNWRRIGASQGTEYRILRVTTIKEVVE